MPFKSKAQRKFLFANEPALAREFARKTLSMKKKNTKHNSDHGSGHKTSHNT